MKNYRKLKIHKKYQARTYRGINVPEIILKGKWLESLGFKQGKMVVVKQEKNKLTITVDKNN
ncbi:SymE family type I addiction module toxin [Flavobacterium hungaricum]|uniref:Type I addiction module toxin, SymE family n=1 Tax=Flavobacterium hungaricum TaxID=2082725 RepID=A0ABR9TER3_9FLAO|nr:SymE family type I addiction module toxin [Flavobacterium hungaricum]MBE8723840.1 type I addiction module toxin, SymE family [Flavobacterium hungaricum]